MPEVPEPPIEVQLRLGDELAMAKAQLGWIGRARLALAYGLAALAVFLTPAPVIEGIARVMAGASE
jgi:hypothetical protein